MIETDLGFVFSVLCFAFEFDFEFERKMIHCCAQINRLSQKGKIRLDPRQ